MNAYLSIVILKSCSKENFVPSFCFHLLFHVHSPKNHHETGSALLVGASPLVAGIKEEACPVRRALGGRIRMGTDELAGVAACFGSAL
jgi:hypothetical protein